MNSHKLAEFETSDEELPESNDPYEVPKNDDEWIESITSTRKNDKTTAIQNIKEKSKSVSWITSMFGHWLQERQSAK